MNDSLISIIVPAYNIEPYIERCLESIMNQEYMNLEIIVVNDGSTDKTGEIIEKCAEKDKRIVAIHKENGGVSSARITGIKKATGAYIGFVDGDDYIEPNMYSILIENAKKYDADISHCGYKMIFPSRIDYYYNTGKIVEQNNIDGVKDLIEGKYIEPGMCNKLYRRFLFNQILEVIPLDIKNNEDLLINYFLFKNAKKAIYQDVCPYHYILRKGSAATAEINEHKLKDPVKVMEIIEKNCKNILELSKCVQERLISQYAGILVMKKNKNISCIEAFQKEIRIKLKKKIPTILFSNKFSLKIKMKTVWALYAPFSYRMIHKLYSKLTGIDKKYEIQ